MKNQINTTIESYEPVPEPDESIFRLSAFGLPEPAGIVWEKPTPRYYWYVGAGVGLIFLSIIIRIAVRKFTKPSTPASST